MADEDANAYPALRLLIDGEWLTAGSRRIHHVIEPATGVRLGELPLADAADLDRALDAAQRGYRLWRATPAIERGAVLKKAAALLRERVEMIARNATREEGKTLAETRAEVQGAANLFEFYAEEARRVYGRVLVRPPGQRSIVVHEPVGPVAAFAPWNFPVNNPARKLGAPVAAGCSVILKPAEEAPASAIAVVQALLDAGLPAGVVQLVFGVPDEVSRHLLASPIIRKLSFTGSTVVGKHLMKLAADGMKRTTMELGGHGPVIVFDDCDLDKTVETLALGKARNAGQVCVSPTRFYVQEGIHDRFVEAFSARFGRVAVGNGLDPTSQMGPMANPRRPEAMQQFISDALAKGARLRTGGEGVEGDGFFWQPTVMSDVPVEARIMNEEPFGPVVVTARFKGFDDVVEQANRLPFGLAGYAFTENARTANLIGDALEVGMVGINTVMMAQTDSPFGGVKESGHGAEDGPEGLAACLVTKRSTKSEDARMTELKIGGDKGYLRIATEEAFMPPETVDLFGEVLDGPDPDPGFQSLWGFYLRSEAPRPKFIRQALMDLGEGRIADMDERGIDRAVIALTAPGTQILSTDKAVAFSVLANDQLAEACRKYPDRFTGMAACAPQDPDHAAKEIERAVSQLGMKAVIINSHTQGHYLDEPQFAPILEAAEALDVPIYIHPTTLPRGQVEPLIKAGIDGAIFGFGVETGMHALRLIVSGTLDRFPKLQIIIGHMGEALPFWMYRLDFMQQAGVKAGRYESSGPLKKEFVSNYLKENFVITNSGVAWEPAIKFTQDVIGKERVMYAMDYPYQCPAYEVEALDAMDMSLEDKRMFFQTNAERVFRL